MLSATKELFTFIQCESYNSKRHLQCGSDLLTGGCRMFLIGSVNDAVVPLFSSLWQGLSPHTHIIRGIFVETHLYHVDLLYTILTLLLYLLNNNIHGDLLNNNHSLYSVSDILVHISGFIRGRLLDKNGGSHSAIHREHDVYNCGVEYMFSLPNITIHSSNTHINTNNIQHTMSHITVQPNEPTLNCNSYSFWAPYINDSYTTSAFNRHILLMRCKQLIQLLYSINNDNNNLYVNSYNEIELLQYMYSQYVPRNKQLKVLYHTLKPLLGNMNDNNKNDNNDVDQHNNNNNTDNSTQKVNTTVSSNNNNKNNSIILPIAQLVESSQIIQPITTTVAQSKL